MTPIRIGIIGFGRMGRLHLAQLQRNPKWEVAYICDRDAECRAEARRLAPEALVVADEEAIFADPSVGVAGLYALADSRLEQIGRAFAAGKHVIAEKPIADRLDNEWRAVELAEQSGLLSTVNLYLRNSWYHQTLRSFIDSGELGELAVLRICHLTPGLAPGEGHEYEGPSFHDCGMHYVDIARWYARSDYKTLNAQAVRMWDYKDPWFLQAHGTFANGVVFDITQGHVYGQLSKDQTHNAYIDIIGSRGIARMTHDFKNATVELHGTGTTARITRPFGEKNIDVLVDRFADAILTGSGTEGLPQFRDAAVASEVAWKCLQSARANDLPSIGTEEELISIRDRRSKMTNGYGLLHKHRKTESPR